MDFMKEYEKWLASPALSAEEKAELEAIRTTPRKSSPGSTVPWSSAPPVCGAPCMLDFIT